MSDQGDGWNIYGFSHVWILYDRSINARFPGFFTPPLISMQVVTNLLC